MQREDQIQKYESIAECDHMERARPRFLFCLWRITKGGTLISVILNFIFLPLAIISSLVRSIPLNMYSGT